MKKCKEATLPSINKHRTCRKFDGFRCILTTNRLLRFRTMEPKTRPSEQGSRSTDRLDWQGSGLSPAALRIVNAFAEAMFADENERGEIVAAEPQVCLRATLWMDHSISRASGDVHRGIGLLVWVLEFLPIFVIGSFSRMSRLSVAERIVYLEALEKSRIGLIAMLLVAFKVPMAIAVFEEGEELRSTGFDRPSTTARRQLPLHTRTSNAGAS